LKKRLLQNSSSPTTQYENKAKQQGFSCIAGIDEVGRGPIAGPVVAACLVLKTNSFINKIADSKKLTPIAREIAYREISAKAFIGIGLVSENFIERINIHNATILAMKRALFNLRVQPDFLLIDGIINLGLPIKQLSIIGGDRKCLSIAAASIIAKVTRDRLMVFYDKLYPEYGFARHKGYGTSRHFEAVRELGILPLHRRWGQLTNL